MNNEAYFLTTERLGFRVWTEHDFDLAWGLWGDSWVTKLIGGPFSTEQVRDRLAKEIATQSGEGVQYWPIFRLVDDAHVGCCGLRPYRPEERVLELGFHLCFEHWGNGYGSEAARGAIGHAFGPLACRGLFAGHHPQNAASAHVLERLGFRRTQDELYPPTGLVHHCYMLIAPTKEA